MYLRVDRRTHRARSQEKAIMLRTYPLARRTSGGSPSEISGAIFEVLEPRLMLSTVPGPAYEVWGGFTDFRDLPDPQSFCLNIDQQDYEFLGGADVTDVFTGQYDFYVVAARYPVAVDAITWGEASLPAGWLQFNVRDPLAIQGYPDAEAGIVGQTGYPGDYRGFVAFENPGLTEPYLPWDGVMVHTTPLPSGPLEVYAEREAAWYDGRAQLEYEYDVSAGGADLTRIEIITPWEELFDSDLYLPTSWAGENFVYEGEGLYFEAYREGPEQFFDVEWYITQQQWDTLETGSTSVAVTYSGGTWNDSVDLSTVALPSQVPVINYPYQGQTDAPVDLTVQWDPWIEPPMSAAVGVEVWDIEMDLADEDGYEAYLPPTASNWTVPRLLAPVTDHFAGVWFTEMAFHETYGAMVGAFSTTSSEVSFRTEPGELFEAPDLMIGDAVLSREQVNLGETVWVRYQLANDSDIAAGPFEVGVYLSDDSLVDTSDARMQVETLPGLGAYEGLEVTASFEAPSAAGVYYIAVMADDTDAVVEYDEFANWSDVLALEVIDPTQALEFSFADFFPMTGGLAKDYLFIRSGTDGKTVTARTRTVIGQDIVQLGQDQVTEFRRYYNSRHSASTYYTMDGEGLSLYGQRSLAGGAWRYADFEPALLMCPEYLWIGQSVVSSVQWSGTDQRGRSWSGEYNQQLDVLGFEQIITPAGQFNALKLRFQITADRSTDGSSVLIIDDYYAWLHEGLGVVREAGTWSETMGEDIDVWTFSFELTRAPLDLIVGGEPTVDLVARLGNTFVPPDYMIPGSKLYVPVIVQNQGINALNSRLAVELYASSDGILGDDDFLLGRAENVRPSLSPGASRSVAVRAVVPDGAVPGEYFILAYVDADNAIPEIWEDNNVASSEYASQYLYRFGNVGSRRGVRLTMADPLGTPVTFSLRGPGYGEVLRSESGELDVYFYQTEPTSVATIRSPRRTNGVVDDVMVLSGEFKPETLNGTSPYVEMSGIQYLDGIDSGNIGYQLIGSLRSLNARNIDLTGDVVIEGYLGAMTFDDVATLSGLDEYDHHIVIGPPITPKGSVRITFGSVAELSIVSGTPIGRLTVSEWLDNSEIPDRIVAQRVGRVLSRGDRRRGIIGHFGADVMLNRPKESLLDVWGPQFTGLGPVTIRGDLYGVDWDIFGRMSGLRVTGRIENATIRTSEGMGRISFGAALNADFLAGVSPEVHGLPESPVAIINSAAAIQSVTMRPAALPGTGETPFFQNSSFSAASIGRVSLVNVIPVNEGIEFGFYAGTIASISHLDTETGHRWTWRKQDDGALAIFDFMADAFNIAGPGGSLNGVH